MVSLEDRILRCQGVRMKLVALLLPVALALLGLLWDIRGDVQYTKGRVDVLVKEMPAVTTASGDTACLTKDEVNKNASR